MKIKENRKSKDILFVVIILLLVAVLVSLIGFAYARYRTLQSGQAQAQLARWNFNVTVDSSQNLDIDLADTRLANDTDKVQSGYVAPGTKGAFEIAVDTSNSDVSVTYEIGFSTLRVPKNLHFYIDENMKNEIDIVGNTFQLDGYIGYTEQNKVRTQTIYWSWPFETGETEAEIASNDIDDSRWMGQDILLNLSVIGKQAVSNGVTVSFDNNYFENDLYSKRTVEPSMWGANYSSIQTQVIANENAKYGKCFVATIKDPSKNNRHVGPYCKTKSIVGDLENGTTYTYSLYVRASNENVELHIGPENQRGEERSIYKSNEWKKIVTTFVVVNPTSSNFVFYDMDRLWQDGDILYVHSLELMEGEPTYYTISTERNTNLQTLITPKRTGYEFLGWYTDPIAGERVTSSTVITQDMTVYAHWRFIE